MTGRFVKNKRQQARALASKERRPRHQLERLFRHSDQILKRQPMSARNMRARIDRELAQQRRAGVEPVLREGVPPGAGSEGTAGAVLPGVEP